MRGAVSIGALMLLAAALGVSTASAEPPADEDEKKSEPAPVRIDPFGGIDFGNVVATQPSSSSSAAARPTLDLFPPLLFGDDLLSFRPGGSNEHRNGFALPYDADWRVQAAQVSAMVVGFAALAALCSGGGCMLPGSWLPDQLEAEPFFTPDPLPVNVAGGRDLGR